MIVALSDKSRFFGTYFFYKDASAGGSDLVGHFFYYHFLSFARVMSHTILAISAGSPCEGN